jgi:glycosyltransferase involved in cell wall biosynthesis
MSISVIIPAYNADKYIRKAVESTLKLEVFQELF